MRRHFEFVGGGSSKFWTIELSGSSYTVNYGRIGTAGQSQTKSLGSEAEALKAYEQLIAEKTRKGYQESGAAPTQAAAPAATTPAPTTPAAKTPAPEPPVSKAPEPPAPISSAFDREHCLERLRKITTTNYGTQADWESAGLSSSMSRAEASFWLSALTKVCSGARPPDAADRLIESPPPTDPSSAEVLSLLKSLDAKLPNSRILLKVPKQATLVLTRLLSLEELLDVLLTADPYFDLIGPLRETWVPQLNEEQKETVRQHIAPMLANKPWPTDPYEHSPLVWHLASMVGLREPLRALVGSWPDQLYSGTDWDHTHYHKPQSLVLGLGDGALAEMQRLKLPLNRPHYLRDWLATTKIEGFAYARDCILNIKQKEEAEELTGILATCKHPQMAPCMLELRLNSKAPKIARDWLEENLEAAVRGLAEAANGRGRLAEAAIQFLREAKGRGLGPLLASLPGERLRREVIEWEAPNYQPLDATTTPSWLTISPPKAKLPAWLAADRLPPLVLGDRCLTPDQLNTLLLTLSKATLEDPPALLREARQHFSLPSREAFAWALLEAWLSEGAPSKERWAMTACGILGGDQTALRLTPLIRKWPGEAQHPRAVFGLECLRAIGTDTALMCLNGMAQKLEFKALKAKAMECMEGIAAQRKMTRAELEDRIVPDCGLDPGGSRVFDFGPRQFRFVLGPEMKPMIQDPEGKIKADLPAPTGKDDTELARAAHEAWKLLKKQIKEVAKIQAERLEQAMVTGRRWSFTDFKSLLVEHPLMGHLVRLLLWGTYTPELRTLWRVSEDQGRADLADQELPVTDQGTVGLVHPLHLSAEQKRAWGQVFSDYEIVPPFAQLGRAIHELAGGEATRTEIDRYRGRKIPATALVGTLERLGWTRGIPQDGGVFFEHSKPFYGANVTAVINYEGVPAGYMQGWDDQEIERCFFVPGICTPESYPDIKQAVTLGTVDPVAISEVLKDLATVAAKATS